MKNVILGKSRKFWALNIATFFVALAILIGGCSNEPDVVDPGSIIVSGNELNSVEGFSVANDVDLWGTVNFEWSVPDPNSHDIDVLTNCCNSIHCQTGRNT